jgi:predicted transcriptional regulator
MIESTLNRTQIYLSASQQFTLAAMARAQRSSSSALIRRAIDQFIAQQPVQDHAAKRMQAAGQWQADNGAYQRISLEELRNEERSF